MKPILLLCAAAMAFASGAHAANVTYTTANFAGDGSNASILANNGTVVSAVNFSTDPVRNGTFSATNPDPNVTVNGIAFTAAPGTASGGLTGSFYSVNSAGLDNDRDSNVSYATAPMLDGLVYDVIRTGSNGTGMVFNLTNLTIGQPYQVQFIFSASDGARRLYLTSQADADLAGATNILTYGTTNGAGLLTGTFTADAATQTFNFWNTNTGSQRVSVAGFVLQTVPEPGVTALGLLGALPMLRRRRRA
jgi:MYXO-CTERM domain-containing protein